MNHRSMPISAKNPEIRPHYLICCAFALIALTFGTCNHVFAQDAEPLIAEMIEKRYPEAGSDEAEAYGEALRWLMDHPVHINRDPAHQLARIPGLNMHQARNIVIWRNEHRWFASLEELDEVEGIGRGTLEQLRPFATVGNPSEVNKKIWSTPAFWTEEGEFSLMSRFRMMREPRVGFRKTDGSGYRGDRIQFYQRLRYRSRPLDLSLTQQKDAGETWDWQTGGDHLVGYLSLQDVGRLNRLVIGNFDVTAGEGLLLGGGSLLGKGRNVLESPVRRSSKLAPFGSSREHGYFRGLGFSYMVGRTQNVELTGWGSRRRLDARPLTGDTVRYSTESGYHRTSSEWAKKERLGRRTWGAKLRWQHAYGSVGWAGYTAGFDQPVARSSSGSRAAALLPAPHYASSIHHHTSLGRWLFYGEAAVNRERRWGLMQGIHHSLSDRTGLAVAYRRYAVGHHSLFGGGFGESVRDAERGLYVGMSHQLTPQLKLNAYFDQYRFDQSRYGYSRPSRGHDWLFSIDIQTNSGWDGYLQLKGDHKQEERERIERHGHPVRTRKFRPRHTLRLHFQRSILDAVRLRFRTEGTRIDPIDTKPQYGFLLYQDLRWTLREWLQVDLRLTLFETDDYDSRVYQFENDLLYVMSNKMLHGMGRRSYVLLHLEPLAWLECWIKYGVTRYSHQFRIGSGLGEIEGSRQSKIGVQMRMKW